LAKATMPKRIALMLNIRSQQDPASGTLRISDVDTKQALSVHSLACLLTLEREPDATFSRGHLRLLDAGVSYPIQSNVALFEALTDYVGRAEQTE
jgi:hypothetical protein